MRKKIIAAVVCGVCLLILVAACASKAVNFAGLNGKIWQLTAMNDGKSDFTLPSDAKITLIIDGSRVYGYAGINSYTGTLENSKKTVKFGPFASTMIGADEPRMNFERTYLRLLESADSAVIKNADLVLSNKKENSRMVFTEFVLPGTKWQLTGYNTGNAIVSDSLCANAFIELLEDGKIAGTSGYNNFSGTYYLETQNGEFKANLTGTTRMAPPPEAAEFEQRMFNLLGSAQKFTCNGNTLNLTTEEGVTLLNFHLLSGR